MRGLVSFLLGGLFGLGLLVSGMTDTVKVQAFLDLFGLWDPTLAFVMGGAMIPMALAWRVAARRQVALLGGPLPGPARKDLGPDLILGSVLFGAGWALAGLCPGPALASFTFAGTRIEALVFLVALAAGMLAAKPLRARFAPATQMGAFGAPNKGSRMDIRHLTPDYAVSPQITPEDLATLKSLGFTTIINNRPDGEIPADWSNAVMEQAARDLGLGFVVNPIRPGDFSDVVLDTQAAAIGQGKVLAYCASGNRSSCAWALAAPGSMSVSDRIAIPAGHGYNLEPLRAMIAARLG